jgi:hypothetical protein
MIFERMEHQLVKLAWLCHFLAVDAQREISGRQLGSRFRPAEQAASTTT